MLLIDAATYLVSVLLVAAVGAVVGATLPRAASDARRLLPRTPMLLPGGGAQGATPADVASLDLSCWQLAFSGAEPVRTAATNDASSPV